MSFTQNSIHLQQHHKNFSLRLKPTHMKRFLQIVFISFTSILTAQENLRPAHGTYLEDIPDRKFMSGNRDVIWSEDFSNGIDGEWQNTEDGGIAFWEFRGPLTDPNVEIGSRGTCVPVGTQGDHIASVTWDNGFVIFDSNWWDNSDNPCSPDNFGTGPAPGPHHALLTSPSIDLSSHLSVALVFNQYMKMYEGETRIEVSANGGPWNVVFTNPQTPNPTLTNAEQYVQISAFAGGQSDVKIRFVFDGMYYFWQLDDLTIIDTYTNDLATRNSTFGDFDLFDLSHPTGYEFLEYSKYPDEMAPLLKFSTQCDNLGGAAQTNCRLNVNVLDESNNVIHSAQTAEGFVIPSGSGMELRAGSFQMPSDFGQYKIAFETSQDETEEFEGNNRDTLTTIINDVQYARDKYFTSAVFLGPPEFGNSQYEIGNIFLITTPNLACHSLSVAVGIGSSTPATIYGAIYSYDFSALTPATLIATTQSIELTPSMFNSYGDQILTNLVFDTPVAVEEGVSYFVAVGSAQGPEFFVCGLSGDALEFTALVKYFPDNWFTLDRIPMVRMNFGPFDDVKEIKAVMSSLSVFPVPSQDIINVSVKDWMHEDFDIIITDHAGRAIEMKSYKKYQQAFIQLDIKNLSSGLYDLVIYSDKKNAHAQFIRQ